jgi:hypothetical protein
MLLFNIDKIENTEIVMYFKYRHLDTGEIAEIFERLDKLYKILLENSHPIYYSEKYNTAFRNFLEIESINTGQSITIKFKEGWKPEFKLIKQELELRISKKLGIPAIVLFFLLTGVQKVSHLYNDYLNDQLLELEIKLKQIELYEKIENRNNSIRTNNTKKYQRQADETIQILINNQNIYYIAINGTIIKNDE